MTTISEVSPGKLKFSVERILGTNEYKDSVMSASTGESRSQEPPCAGCVAALYRCCRDEPPLLQIPLPIPYTHLHPALRPTTTGTVSCGCDDDDKRKSQEPPCAGCVAALYRCCRDEPPLLQIPLPIIPTHIFTPPMRPTTT
ncbi:hypothetical protein ACJJTC_014566, partial [Scirpophaga incertulas]